MEINLKKSTIFILIISLLITALEIVGWLFFSYYIILPNFKNSMSDVGDWLQGQGPAALGLLIPAVFYGMFLLVIYIIFAFVPLMILIFYIIIFIFTISAKKRSLFIALAIYSFITLNLISAITSLIILKKNPNA